MEGTQECLHKVQVAVILALTSLLRGGNNCELNSSGGRHSLGSVRYCTMETTKQTLVDEFCRLRQSLRFSEISVS